MKLDARHTEPGADPEAESLATASFVLPSDMLCALHTAGAEESQFHVSCKFWRFHFEQTGILNFKPIFLNFCTCMMSACCPLRC